MQDQNVLITGAASGIGRALATAAMDQGARNLILLDIDRGGLEATAQLVDDERTHIHQVNIADGDALTEVFNTISAAHGHIDTLFNSAGIQTGTPAWPDVSPARIQAVINVNVTGLMLVTHFVLPLMKSRGGAIVNIASVSGLNAYLSGAVYGASKAAVIHFTACNEQLHKDFDIRMNALCPGMVNTPFLNKTGKDGKIADWLQEQVNSGNVLSADDVAEAAIALAGKTEMAGQYEIIEYSVR